MACARPVEAAGPFSPQSRDPHAATTSAEARQAAVRSIPFQHLNAKAQAKVKYVLADVALFRRLPTRVVDCDPNLYLFLVRHPDVVVNIWEVLKLSELKVRQVSPTSFQITEPQGTLANFEFLYSSHDTQVVYGEGLYEGPLALRPVRGQCLLILKSGYVQETDGRHYVTNRLDAFVRIEQGGVKLLTQTFHPLVGKVADNNFIQSVAFVGSLSRTAEVNANGVRRLAAALKRVSPTVRSQFTQLTDAIAIKEATASAEGEGSGSSGMAVQAAYRTRE